MRGYLAASSAPFRASALYNQKISLPIKACLEETVHGYPIEAYFSGAL